MASSRIDKYVNRAFASVTMSAANTITFEQIRFAVGTFQGIGLLLHKILYYPTHASIREMVAAADSLLCCLTLRDDLTSLDPTSQAVISHVGLVGVAANVEPVKIPLEDDFTTFPGGGLLLPANPIYLAMATSNAAAASELRAVLEYTFVNLSDKESIELLQTIIPGNV